MNTQKYTRYFPKYCKYCFKLHTASSPGHDAFLILNGGEHDEHGDHDRPHPLSQRQHGLWKVASKNVHKNARLISLVFNMETETFLWIKVLSNLLSGFHHTVECVKKTAFTATYYSENSNQHKHFLDRKIIAIYK